MRDIRRIKLICNLVELLWDRFPNQRLGQLLSNFVFGHHTDIFFLEDEITEVKLQRAIKFYEKLEKKNEKYEKTRKAKNDRLDNLRTAKKSHGANKAKR